MGGVVGFVAQMQWLLDHALLPQTGSALLLFASSSAVAALFMGGQKCIVSLWERQGDPEMAQRFALRHSLSYMVFLAIAVGVVGVNVTAQFWKGVILAFLLLNGWMACRLHGAVHQIKWSHSPKWLAGLFFLSGIAALIYQVVWQRTLFAFVGTNIESETLVVVIFMLGLGLGALLGGKLSQIYQSNLPELFLLTEVLIGIFGLCSLPLMTFVGTQIVTASLLVTGCTVFGLLVLPTMLMGSTLPILVSFLNERMKHIAKTLSLLYFLNTLGSAVACFLTVDLLFAFCGQQLTAVFAACCNVIVGLLVYRFIIDFRKT